MRNALLGGFLGVMLGALVLAACGGVGTPSGNVTQAELDTQLAGLQQQITDLKTQLDAHEADTTIHGGGTTPALGLNYCIATVGTFPSRSLTAGVVAGDVDTALSADPLIGGIALFAGNFAPRGWAFCEGQTLDIASNTALFSILGTQYGGDGRTNFKLPDLRGRVPVQPDANLRLGETRD
jgi:microcystin-dependent protein